MDKFREKEEIRENEADKDKICGRNAVIEAIKSGREIDKIMVAKGATNLGKLYAMAKEAGFTTLANMVLMGKLIKETGAVSFENNQATFEKFIPAKKIALIEQNCQALQAGYDF